MEKIASVAFLRTFLKWCTILLVVKVLGSILSNYPDYFPPSFDSDFLLGREGHFFGAYCIAFYSHILSTPCALLSGFLLMNRPFRKRFPTWHRRLGQIHVVGILAVVVPSSLWMSAYAYTGRVAGFGFGSLALITCVCALMGWRRAVQRNFKKHQTWMTRCFILLCSAIVLRIISGIAALFHWDAEWTYPIAAWASWIVPLVGLEIWMTQKWDA